MQQWQYCLEEEVVLKWCALFDNCISEIKNTETDNAKYLDIIMPMYKLKEYRNKYSKISKRLWQYHRDEPALTSDSAIKKKQDIE